MTKKRKIGFTKKAVRIDFKIKCGRPFLDSAAKVRFSDLIAALIISSVRFLVRPDRFRFAVQLSAAVKTGGKQKQ